MAKAFLRILGVIQLAIVAVSAVVVFGTTQDTVQRALGEIGEPAALVIVLGAIAGAALALVFASVSLGIAPAVGRGGGAAKTTAAVLCLLVLAWTGAVMLLNPDGGVLSLFAGAADINSAVTVEEFQRRINDAVPSWLGPTNLGLGAASLLAAVVALLSLMARKPSQA